MFESANISRDNDTRLVELARDISTAQWAKPSLCTEWTNHEVLAHLVVGYGVALSAVGSAMLHHRGSFDVANAELARALAARCSPDRLLDELAALTRRPRGIGRLFPRRLLLGDHVIHELDIAYALGKESAVPMSTVVAVLNTEVRVPNPFVPAAARSRGLDLVATDANWVHQDGGPVVTGRAAHLVSVLAGRPWALSYLRGEGVAVLSSRM
ncbi:maleylpyruvate isomerase family mycothiol-dependent enzyme [Mycobacterium stomatepiae]|uniref:Mycothiol-dependent maleylpyruvate isomerase metal-binding domain-containing protein n=1 Tax=Mycobacterium stomatepiae TaxID=470076 RepID=A0A7I7QD89_9MYCO|nr:maleylpyruvate isomerase family mycothiol-dependent enzyme [Mycobacterium stomatepiae]MCV7167911.1 maleylpyruvate isomerase family mycothiol-dependent enzyme [Mycobacterium stomatepiae]BBY24006.1 hypothetical protein MSTO_42110 [Mycobacterium stomatepiae]